MFSVGSLKSRRNGIAQTKSVSFMSIPSCGFLENYKVLQNAVWPSRTSSCLSNSLICCKECCIYVSDGSLIAKCPKEFENDLKAYKHFLFDIYGILKYCLYCD